MALEILGERNARPFFFSSRFSLGSRGKEGLLVVQKKLEMFIVILLSRQRTLLTVETFRKF